MRYDGLRLDFTPDVLKGVRHRLKNSPRGHETERAILELQNPGDQAAAYAAISRIRSTHPDAIAQSLEEALGTMSQADRQILEPLMRQHVMARGLDGPPHRWHAAYR